MDASMEIFALCCWTFLWAPEGRGEVGDNGVERVSAAGRESDATRRNAMTTSRSDDRTRI